RAGSSLKHPGRNFQPAIRVRPAHRAAENETIGLLKGFMNGHLKLKPRVQRIQELPKHGPVGVLKPCSTTTTGPTTPPWRKIPGRVSPRLRLRTTPTVSYVLSPDTGLQIMLSRCRFGLQETTIWRMPGENPVDLVEFSNSPQILVHTHG